MSHSDRISICANSMDPKSADNLRMELKTEELGADYRFGLQNDVSRTHIRNLMLCVFRSPKTKIGGQTKFHLGVDS
jgi:hypothetical protein